MYACKAYPAISSTDYVNLADIVTSGLQFWRISPNARPLSGALVRARVVAPPELSRDVISMHADFEFRDGCNGQVRRATLVYPTEEDVGAGKVSVLSPFGTALLGARALQTVKWRSTSGELRTLRVLRVLPRSERLDCRKCNAERN